VRSRAWSSADRTSGEAATSRSGATAETATLTGPTPVIVDNRVAAIIRRPIVWLLAAAFATQSTVYYALSTWFPTILLDTTDVDAVGAGALSSVFQGVAIVGAMIAPLLLRFVGAVYSALLLGVF